MGMGVTLGEGWGMIWVYWNFPKVYIGIGEASYINLVRFKIIKYRYFKLFQRSQIIIDLNPYEELPLEVFGLLWVMNISY